MLQTLGFDLDDRASLTFERGLPATQGLPTENDHLDVLRIDFQTAANALRRFGRGKCRAEAEKRFVNQLAELCMVHYWASVRPASAYFEWAAEEYRAMLEALGLTDRPQLLEEDIAVAEYLDRSRAA
jgi:hypothetical protein